jgi:hypothetical protein
MVMTETLQRTEILAAVLARGWRLASTIEGDWWADETLVLESEWSPVGLQLVLTFLVDPQHDLTRRKGEGVWAVVASTEPLTDRTSAGSRPLLSLGSGWKARLAGFIRELDALRSRG